MNLKCISEWDRCLPQPEELTPLSQKLIPHELACAFNMLPPSSSSACTVTTTSVDVLNASHSAFKSHLQKSDVRLSTAESEQKSDSEMALPLGQGNVDDDRKPQGIVQAVKEGIGNNLCGTRVSQSERIEGALVTGSISPCARGDDYPSVSFLAPGLARGLSHFMSSASYMQNSAHLQVQESTTAYLSQSETHFGGTGGSILEAANLTQLKLDPSDETDLAPSIDIYRAGSITMSNEEQSARTVKKPRLVWTPQLHKRFVDAVAHLGFNHAVPKTIMQLMNVDGLTRENVASHLQKYRLYLKRMQGFSNEGPSSTDQLFASTPVPPSLAASAHHLVSHHNQHGDPSFGTVQNANLSSILGHPARLVTPAVSFPTLSFSGCNPQPSFSMLQRAPSSIPLINLDLGREGYMPETSSAPDQILSLFPSGSK